MKICVIGAGAIGGLLAAKLAQAGEEVGVVARGAHLAAIRENGLDPASRRAARSSPASRRPTASPMSASPISIVLGMKAHQVAAVARRRRRRSWARGPWCSPRRTAFPGGISSSTAARARATRLESVDPGGDHRRPSADRPRHRRRRLSRGGDRAAGRHPAYRGQSLLARRDRRRQNRARRRALGDFRAGPASRRRSSADVRTEIWTKLWGNLSLQPDQRADPCDAGGHLPLSADTRRSRREMMREAQSRRRGVRRPLPHLRSKSASPAPRRSARTRPRCCRTSRAAARSRSTRCSAR